MEMNNFCNIFTYSKIFIKGPFEKKYLLAIVISATTSAYGSTFPQLMQHFQQQQIFQDIKTVHGFLEPLMAQEDAFKAANEEAKRHYDGMVSTGADYTARLTFATNCMNTAKNQMEHFNDYLKSSPFKATNVKPLADCLPRGPHSSQAAYNFWQSVFKGLGTAPSAHKHR